MHVGKVVEAHFFKSVTDGGALLHTRFVQRIVRSVLVAGALGVAENEGHLFSGAEAAEHVVDRRELVGGGAECLAFGAERFEADSILAVFSVLTILTVFAVFTIEKFANLFGATIDVVTVDCFILYDRARGSVLTVLTVVTILAIFAVFTIGTVLAVSTLFAVLEFTDLDVAAEDVVAVVGQVFFDAAGSSVLTVVSILAVFAVFTIGTVLAVSTLSPLRSSPTLMLPQ